MTARLAATAAAVLFPGAISGVISDKIQKSTDPGPSSSKHPFCCLRLLVSLGTNHSAIYPCFLASRMLGSAGFPWFYGATAPFRNEDSLTIAYIGAGLALSIVAYDYHEIGILVILFCIFHACVGFILPSLARLSTKYLPNELRGGMMSFSLSLAHVEAVEKAHSPECPMLVGARGIQC